MAFQKVGYTAVVEGVGPYVQNIQKIEGASKGLSNTVQGTGSKLAGLGTAISGAVTGFVAYHEITSAIGETQTLGLEVAKLSRETGLTTESASRLLFTFKHFGLEAGDASRSIGIFAKKLKGISDEETGVTTGGKSTAEILKSLGVEATDAAGNIKPIDDLIPQLSDKFAAMPDGLEKTGLAMQLFGRSGKDMIPVLNLGSEGMKELGAEADKLGVVLSGKNVADIKKFTFAQRDMKEALGGLKLVIGLAVLPALTKFLKVIVDHQPAVRSFLVLLGKGLGPVFVAMGKQLLFIANLFKFFGGAVVVAITDVGRGLTELRSAAHTTLLEKLGLAVKFVYEWFGRLLAPVREAVRHFFSFEDESIGLGAAIGRLPKPVQDAYDAIIKLLGFKTDPLTALKNLLGGAGGLAEGFNAGAIAANVAALAIGTFLSAIVIGKVTSFAGEVAGLAGQIAGVVSKTVKITANVVGTGFDILSSIAKGVTQTVTQTFARVGEAFDTSDKVQKITQKIQADTESAKQAGKDLATSLAKGLAQGLGVGISYSLVGSTIGGALLDAIAAAILTGAGIVAISAAIGVAIGIGASYLLSHFVPGLESGIPKNWDQFKRTLGAQLGVAIYNGVLDALSFGATAFEVGIKEPLRAVDDFVNRMSNKFSELAGKAIPAALGGAAGAIAAVVVSLPTLATNAAKFLTKTSEKFNELAGSVGGALEGAVNAVRGFGGDLIKAVGSINLRSVAHTLVSGLIDGITSFLPDLAVNFAVGLFNAVTGVDYRHIALEVARTFSRALADAITALPGIGKAILRELTVSAEDVLNVVGNIGQLIGTGLEAARQAIVEEAKKIGGDLIDGVVQGVTDTVGPFIDTVVNTFNKVYHSARKFLGAESPSKLFAEIGKDIILGLLMGLVDKYTDLFNFFVNLPANLVSALGTIGGILVGAGELLIQGFIAGIHHYYDPLIGFFGGILSSIFTAVTTQSPTALLFSVGGDIIDGLGKGISKVFGGADSPSTLVLNGLAAIVPAIGDATKLLLQTGMDIITGLGKGLLDGLTSGHTPAQIIVEGLASLVGDVLSFLGISSPSTVFSDIGADIIRGLEVGVANEYVNLYNALTALPGEIVTAVGYLGNLLLSAGGDVISGLLQGMWDRYYGPAYTFLASLGTAIVGAVGDLGSTLFGAGQSLIQGFIDGITSLPIPDPTDLIPGSLKDAFGAAKSVIPHWAAGTNYFRGGTAVVGESGPELINLPRGSQIFSNEKTTQLFGALSDLFKAGDSFFAGTAPMLAPAAATQTQMVGVSVPVNVTVNTLDWGTIRQAIHGEVDKQLNSSRSLTTREGIPLTGGIG